MFSFSSFSHEAPYPPVRAERPNPFYAQEILSNIGSCNSEISAVSLYLYNSTILSISHEEFSKFFRESA